MLLLLLPPVCVGQIKAGKQKMFNQTNDSHLPPTRMEVGVTANNLPQFLVQIAGN